MCLCFSWIEYTLGKRKREDEEELEQEENRMNPLRCPVKFFEFYLSKWWEPASPADRKNTLIQEPLGVACCVLQCRLKSPCVFCSLSPNGVLSSSTSIYLLPERTCTIDSDLWYSETPMSRGMLGVLLNRILAVRDISGEPSGQHNTDWTSTQQHRGYACGTKGARLLFPFPWQDTVLTPFVVTW